MKQKIRNLLIASSDLVFIFFLIWFFLSFFTHGRFTWVDVANMFAFPIFVFLTPFAVAGIFYRVRRLQIVSLIALGSFLFTFGVFFLPKQKTMPLSSDILRVMTYNMLVYTPEVSAVADVIHKGDADIVFLQETSFAMANLLEQDMKDIYPYQVHAPSDIPDGLSVISKYPFEAIDYDLGDYWTGTPILLDVTWSGQTIHIVNFHMDPTSLRVISIPNRAYEVAETRKEHAGRLVEFLRVHPGPAILAGDVNDVSLNDPYILLLNAGLQDTWREAGFGLGNTFPGNKSPGTNRLQIAGVYIPEWLVRIDYIFATSEWEVLSANLAETDGYSDHRAVIATLCLGK